MPQVTKDVINFPRTRQGVRNLDAVRGRVVPVSLPAVQKEDAVGESIRHVCTLGGGALMLLGLAQRSVPGFGLALAGGALLCCGVSGYCPVNRMTYSRTGGTSSNTTSGPETVYRVH